MSGYRLLLLLPVRTVTAVQLRLIAYSTASRRSSLTRCRLEAGVMLDEVMAVGDRVEEGLLARVRLSLSSGWSGGMQLSSKSYQRKGA